jgi:hypothetical protein
MTREVFHSKANGCFPAFFLGGSGCEAIRGNAMNVAGGGSDFSFWFFIWSPTSYFDDPRG